MTDYIVIKVEDDGACPECGWKIDAPGHHSNCAIGRLDHVVVDESCVQLIAQTVDSPHVAHSQSDSEGPA